MASPATIPPLGYDPAMASPSTFPPQGFSAPGTSLSQSFNVGEAPPMMMGKGDGKGPMTLPGTLVSSGTFRGFKGRGEKGFGKGAVMPSTNMPGSFGKGAVMPVAGMPGTAMPGLSPFQPLNPAPPPAPDGRESFLNGLFGGLFGEEESHIDLAPVPQQPLGPRPPPQPLLHPSRVRAETRLTAPVSKGSIELPVASSNGFQTGQHVVLSHGSPWEEVCVLYSTTPFILNEATKFDHPPNSFVLAVDAPEGAASPLQQGQTETGLGHLSEEELEEMVEVRNKIIASLEQEVRNMDGTGENEERLTAIERQLSGFQRGHRLPVRAPLLAQLAKVVKDSHEIEHQREREANKNQEHDRQYYDDLCPWKYLTAKDCVMGRSSMPLDRDFIAKQKWLEELERNKHPTVKHLHYAGNIAKPEELVECVWVKEEGVLERRAVYPAPYRNGFWLNLDGHTRHDAEEHRAAAGMAMEDPVARRVMRQDVAGIGEDARAVDWLGKLKRGQPPPPPPKEEDWFRMPKWMY